MFDPKAIFGDIANQKPMDVFQTKQKKSRAGYADDAPLGLHKTTSILTFIESKDPIEHLALWNAFDMKQGNEDILALVNDHEATTDELKHLCSDLKLLSKTEFKQLLKWRLKIVEALKSTKVNPGAESEEESEESDEEELTEEEKKEREDEKLQEEVEEFKEEMDARKRRSLKKEREVKAKMQRRVDMGMEVGRLAERDTLDDQVQQEGLFQLGQIHTDKEGIDELQAGAYAEPSDDEDEEPEEKEALIGLEYEAEQEEWIEEAHKAYLTRRKKRNKEHEPEEVSYMQGTSLPSADGLDDVPYDDDEEDEEEEQDRRRKKKKGNALLVDKPGSKGKETSSARKSERFFSNDLFAGLEDEEEKEEDAFWARKDEKDKANSEAEKGPAVAPSKAKTAKAAAKKEKAVAEEMNADFEEALKNGGTKAGAKRKRKDDDSDSDDDDDWEAVEAAKEAYRQDRQKYLPKTEDALAETLALGQLMLRKKQRMDIVDASYNRYAFNDDGNLPSWFKEEESRHNKPMLPVSKAQMAAMKLQWQAVDARPIKKLAEAKARKKKKKDKAYDMLIKRANAALDADEGAAIQGEKEKLLKQLVSKNMGKGSNTKLRTIVNSKQGNKGVSKGAGGNGGKIKIVDKRMKKDLRSQKSAVRRAQKANYGRVPKSMDTRKRTLSKKEKRGKELGL